MPVEETPVGLTRIERIVVRHVRMALRTPFVTAVGVERDRDLLFVEVHGDGVVGWGEVPVLSAPTYNEETLTTAWHVLNDFFVPDALALFDDASGDASDDGLGDASGAGGGGPSQPNGRALEGVVTPRDVAARLTRYKGHAFAKAGLEGAFWDAAAKKTGLPLATLLLAASKTGGGSGAGNEPGVRAGRDADAGASNVDEGKLRDRVPSGVVVDFGEDEEGVDGLLGRVESRLQEGYRRIKLKIAPGRDAAPVAAVRRAFGDVELSVDANGSYRPDDGDALRALDEFGLVYIEQPLPDPDVDDHAVLQRRLATALCLDESIRNEGDARRALALGSCRIVNVKASRVGGLTEAVAVHDACFLRGVPLLCGGLLESGIGRAHNVALARLPGFSLPADLSASDRYWTRDVVEPAFALDGDGFLPAPDGPGIGTAVDEAFVAALTVRKKTHAGS